MKQFKNFPSINVEKIAEDVNAKYPNRTKKQKNALVRQLAFQPIRQKHRVYNGEKLKDLVQFLIDGINKAYKVDEKQAKIIRGKIAVHLHDIDDIKANIKTLNSELIVQKRQATMIRDRYVTANDNSQRKILIGHVAELEDFDETLRKIKDLKRTLSGQRKILVEAMTALVNALDVINALNAQKPAEKAETVQEDKSMTLTFKSRKSVLEIMKKLTDQLNADPKAETFVLNVRGNVK
ncbi:MAG: hypothetical protein IJH64_02995 [Oscillospiraceae bacterium]|nr:hypothetical protein [Oscillospiraceae bacterium]